MRRVRETAIWLLGLAVSGAAACGAAPEPAASSLASVRHVQDGDSFEAEWEGRAVTVRLHGIDAPEHDQPFGDAARREARALLEGRRVRLDVRDRDDYGRLVARVYAGDTDVNLALVEAGCAWHFTRFSEDPVLAAAQTEARAAGRGLWAGADPEPPWEYRRRAEGTRRDAPEGVSAQGAVVANTRSRVFHKPDCPNARCARCTERFASPAAAQDAGYRPAGCCRP